MFITSSDTYLALFLLNLSAACLHMRTHTDSLGSPASVSFVAMLRIRVFPQNSNFSPSLLPPTPSIQQPKLQVHPALTQTASKSTPPARISCLCCCLESHFFPTKNLQLAVHQSSLVITSKANIIISPANWFLSSVRHVSQHTVSPPHSQPSYSISSWAYFSSPPDS